MSAIDAIRAVFAGPPTQADAAAALELARRRLAHAEERLAAEPSNASMKATLSARRELEEAEHMARGVQARDAAAEQAEQARRRMEAEARYHAATALLAGAGADAERLADELVRALEPAVAVLARVADHARALDARRRDAAEVARDLGLPEPPGLPFFASTVRALAREALRRSAADRRPAEVEALATLRGAL